MKPLVKIFILPFLLLLPYVGNAQNLVPNPSFESYSNCPADVGETHKLNNWSSYGNSPDFFHSCATSSIVDVPNNGFGTQPPASGVAYSGFYTYCNDYREYLGTQLISPLAIGQKYFISFKVSRSNDIGSFDLSTNNQGVLFSNTEYTETIAAPTNNFAHVYSSSMITDSVNWTRVFGSFVADSAYQYLIVGNFFDDANTNSTGGSQCAYYYLDDICVSTDSLYSYNWTSISNNVYRDIKVSIYPNPVRESLFINLNNNNSTIYLYNNMGQLLKTIHSNERVEKLNISMYPHGLYLIKTIVNDTEQINKFIKTQNP